MKKVLLIVAVFALGVIAAVAAPRVLPMLSGHHMGADYDPSKHHGNGGMMEQSSTEMQHDEVNMPMLNGKNTTEEEVSDLRKMFQQHPEITRTVELIPNGIKTTTSSDNPELRDAIVSHVASMINRVENLDDPQIPIQSPTLAILFEKGDQLSNEIIPTDTGVTVIQTSTDPEIVAALQKHAGEVSDLAERGMQAVHEQMMSQHH